MCRLSIGAACAALCCVLHVSAGSGVALGAEELVLPFRCEVDGGRLFMDPSPEHSYRILGPRQSQVFRHCGPEGSERCRHWRVHRFDLDCGGQRVSWVDVAAAASLRRDLMVHEGRLSFSAGPFRRRVRERRWDGPPGARFPGRFRRRGADWDRGVWEDDGLDTEEDRVVFPQGFAPALGIPLQFSGVREEIETDLAARSPDTKAPSSVAPAPFKRPKAKPDVSQATTSTSAEKTTPAPKAAPKKQAKAGARKPSASSPAIKPGEVSVTVINRPPPIVRDTQVAGADSASANTRREGEGSAVSSSSSSTGSVPAAPSSGGDGAGRPQGPRPPYTETAKGLYGLPVSKLVLAFAGVLGAVGAGVFFYAGGRCRDRARHGSLSGRDLGTVSLGPLGGPLAKASAGGNVALRRKRSRVVAATTAGSGEETTASSSEECPLPTTVEAALDVLGTNSEASPQAIKKVVDGLRQSWHPDLATTDADRRYREKRIVQINVAWDILSGRQSAA
jgi:hypothetical protein